eukprot:scaffold77037_cov30-Cyclotella_meneghiniana.AAC.1
MRLIGWGHWTLGFFTFSRAWHYMALRGITWRYGAINAKSARSLGMTCQTWWFTRHDPADLA